MKYRAFLGKVSTPDASKIFVGILSQISGEIRNFGQYGNTEINKEKSRAERNLLTLEMNPQQLPNISQIFSRLKEQDHIFERVNFTNSKKKVPLKKTWIALLPNKMEERIAIQI